MTPAMTCPRCGATMNHQADKLREPTSSKEAETARPDGILIAVFACPSCGWIAARPRTEHDS